MERGIQKANGFVCLGHDAKGFNVSRTGYFLYCDGDRFSDYNFLNQRMLQ